MKRLLHFAGCLHHSTSDARSYKRQVHNYIIKQYLFLSTGYSLQNTVVTDGPFVQLFKVILFRKPTSKKLK